MLWLDTVRSPISQRSKQTSRLMSLDLFYRCSLRLPAQIGHFLDADRKVDGGRK